MNRVAFQWGTPYPKHRHLNFMQHAMLEAIKASYSDLLALAQDFYVQGCELATTPGGGGSTVSITAGTVCYKGEPLPVAGHSLFVPAGNVAWLEVSDVGGDTVPVMNAQGFQEEVLRVRTGVLRQGAALPLPENHMGLNAPRKEVLERQKLRGRLVVPGMIMPYYGAMDNFTNTGLGIPGSSMDGWAICNGLNGTVDMRGMVPFGATDVPSSGAPTIYDGVGGSSSQGDTVGADLKQIEADHLPPHSHPHSRTAVEGTGLVNGGSTYGLPLIDVNTGANATAHHAFDVRQASRALVFIQSLV